MCKVGCISPGGAGGLPVRRKYTSFLLQMLALTFMPGERNPCGSKKLSQLGPLSFCGSVRGCRSGRPSVLNAGTRSVCGKTSVKHRSRAAKVLLSEKENRTSLVKVFPVLSDLKITDLNGYINQGQDSLSRFFRTNWQRSRGFSLCV